jgi:ADP-ribose pyrophosphatase
MKDMHFEIIAKDSIYQGFFNLDLMTLRHTLYNGGWTAPLKRELYRRNDCVAVLLYDPGPDRIVLLEQFRVGAMFQAQRSWLLEIVGGAIESGETPEQVAYRETQEEAGCQIEELIEIMNFYTSPGGSSEKITLYCGRVDSASIGGVLGLQEEGEDILVRTYLAEEVYAMLKNGEIESAITIIAIQWHMLHRQELRNKWQ